jgi:hypothetical protein
MSALQTQSTAQCILLNGSYLYRQTRACPAGAGAGGGYGGGNNQGGSQSKTIRGNSEQDGKNSGNGAGGRRQQQPRQPWIDDRHPCIAAMMADYVAARGPRVRLTEILDAANKRIMNLPTIPAYVANGQPFVCWAHILGRCTFANCQFKNGHVPRSAIPDTFAIRRWSRC